MDRERRIGDMAGGWKDCLDELLTRDPQAR
jgi:hypothetical protein